MTQAIRDQNHVTVALGVSSTDSTVTIPIEVDPATGRLLTDQAGGYTNLTQFVDQTAWRIFYSDGSGDVIELALGANGTVLTSNGASAAPTFEATVGDMTAAVYDPAGITEQLVGLTATQTLTNKTINTASNTLVVGIDDISDNSVASTGLLTGGVLTTGAGAAQYSISDGTGLVVTAAGAITKVSWTGKSNITPTNIATSLLTWVAIDSAGNVVEKTTPFTATESRSQIVLGVAVHVDNATVDAVNNEQVVAYQPLSTTYDVAEALGFINVSGNVFSANGANLSIDKSAGVVFKIGSNYNVDSTNPHNRTLAALTAGNFQYRYSDGTNGTTGAFIDPDNLDNGSGGNTALANNKWSVQRIYSFISNNVKIQRGVEEFSTLASAIDGIASEAYVTEQSIADNGLLRGWLVVQKGATDLSNAATAQFIPAPKFGEDSAGGATAPPGDASDVILSALKNTAGTINIGQAVRSVGFSGTQTLIELADANAAGEMPAIGIARATITNAVGGNVVVFGKLEGIDTSTFSVGDALYVGETAGQLTATRPTNSGSEVQALARVLSVDATNGIIEVVGAGRSNDSPNKIEARGDTTAGDTAAMGYTATEGLILTGQGSTNDVTIKNDADAEVISIRTGTTDVDIEGTVFIKEQAEAEADVAGYGQVWVDNTTPNELKYTDDTGIDYNLTKGTIRWLVFNLVEAATDVSTGTNIGGDFVSPIAGTILQSDTTPFYLYATQSTAGTFTTTGLVVDISIGGTSIMTTNKLDFDTTEKTTTTAATPPDLTTTALAVGDIITIDIDSIQDGTAGKGLTVYIAVRET